MGPTEAKIRSYKKELYSCINTAETLIKALEGVSDETDYRRTIGVFAVQAPEWKIFYDESKSLRNIVRKVCTGELTAREARSLVERALTEFKKVDAWLQIPKR